MIRERYVIYVLRDAAQPQGDWDEVSAHNLESFALAEAQRVANRTGKETRVEWLQEEITRNGREILDVRSDLAHFTQGAE